MKSLRLVFTTLAVATAGTWAVAALACDQSSSSASTASTAPTASANGVCTKMSAAECKARMAAGQVCPMHGATAVTASTASANDACSAHRAVSATAAGQCPYSGATTAAAGGCTAHGTTTATTANGKCTTHTANAMTVANTPGHQGCPSKSANTAVHGTCAEHGVSAMAAGLGSNCSGLDANTSFRGPCDACADLTACEAELEAAGASLQTVPIKNGVMFVYTAAAPGQVSAIQSVMSRRTEHLAKILSSGDRAHLCDDCRSMRGAMVSGRMVREVVNIEGGTLVLVTSDDPQLVKRIRNLADAGKTAVKS